MSEVKVTQSCPTLCHPMDYTVHGILQASILEWLSLSLLQGIFPTQGSNPGLPHCRRILYQLSHQGSPRTMINITSLSLQMRILKPSKGQVNLLSVTLRPAERLEGVSEAQQGSQRCPRPRTEPKAGMATGTAPSLLSTEVTLEMNTPHTEKRCRDRAGKPSPKAALPDSRQKV